MKIILFSVLLVFGCATQPTLEELYLQYNHCTLADAVGCETLGQEIEKREAARLAKAEREAPHCPRGTVDMHRGGGHSGCMTMHEVKEMMPGVFR
jgi:hypothetical protein